MLRRGLPLRDWSLFVASALLPALAVGLLGLRALRNEEAAVRREVQARLEATRDRLTAAWGAELRAAAAELESARLDADPRALARELARRSPRFARPVLAGGPGRRPAAPQVDCAALSLALSAGQGDRARALAAFVDGCAEQRSESGRWLWASLATAEGAGASAERIADWAEAHAASLSPAERQALLDDLARGPLAADPARARAERALRWPRAAELVEDARQLDLFAAGPVPGPGAAAQGLATAALRPLPDGRLVGFVLDRTSLERALSEGAVALPPGERLLVRTHEADEGPGPRATARLRPGLWVDVVPTDPDFVARSAARSRRVLGAAGAAAALLALATAAALFARMRAARRSSALRVDFVSAVSHELRTPITSMRVLAELLDSGQAEASAAPELHAALAREARRLSETVDRLLGFGRWFEGRARLERAWACVSDVVQARIDVFEERHPEVSPVARRVAPGVHALCDPVQLGLLLDNLLENARRHAPEGSPYEVELTHAPGSLALRVRDRGPGIEARHQKRIFEPFERLDDRLSHATEGTGLGLSLVRYVATAHGGRVEVQSEPGHGATFVVTLPTRTEPHRGPHERPARKTALDRG